MSRKYLCSQPLLDSIRKECLPLSEKGVVRAFDDAEETHTPAGPEGIWKTVQVKGHPEDSGHHRKATHSRKH